MSDCGNLGDSDPEFFQNAVWFLLTLHMGMRGRDEHYKLQYDDFLVKSTTDGVEYIEFNERDIKTHSGASRDIRAFSPKVWSTPLNPDRCPVRIVESH